MPVRRIGGPLSNLAAESPAPSDSDEGSGAEDAAPAPSENGMGGTAADDAASTRSTPPATPGAAEAEAEDEDEEPDAAAAAAAAAAEQPAGLTLVNNSSLPSNVGGKSTTPVEDLEKIKTGQVPSMAGDDQTLFPHGVQLCVKKNWCINLPARDALPLTVDTTNRGMILFVPVASKIGTLYIKVNAVGLTYPGYDASVKEHGVMGVIK